MYINIYLFCFFIHIKHNGFNFGNIKCTIVICIILDHGHLKLILGHARRLAVPHDLDDNPYPRSPAFRKTAMHYKPSRVGDSGSAELDRLLERVDGKLAKEVLSKELRTLVPTLSILHDTAVFVDDARDELLQAAKEIQNFGVT